MAKETKGIRAGGSRRAATSRRRRPLAIVRRRRIRISLNFVRVRTSRKVDQKTSSAMCAACAVVKRATLPSTVQRMTRPKRPHSASSSQKETQRERGDATIVGKRGTASIRAPSQRSLGENWSLPRASCASNRGTSAVNAHRMNVAYIRVADAAKSANRCDTWPRTAPRREPQKIKRRKRQGQAPGKTRELTICLAMQCSSST
jgi:hypothetical protein